MSTFDGIVAEFPNIRIDHFRLQPSSPPALAFFLSHMHSDHLVGLESCRTFVYCSSATREIVLRLEKRFARINYANGLLEVRKQDYARLETLLKPLPLETPVTIELAPGKKIRVTLFDANHCVGAVMFLIEGDGKSILYTGDIRSEQWWVDMLVRSPILIPYVTTQQRKALRNIDTVYLDTTFASKSDPYRAFPSKAEGIAELLHKLSAYPDDTAFYFVSWTFGYEDVWQAMSNFLGTKVHVDQYKYGLYSALANSKELRAPEAFKMILAHCGNHPQEGCLTASTDRARIHSCEQSSNCDIQHAEYVKITPIISRHHGQDMVEPGAGGGQGDIDQSRYELEMIDRKMLDELRKRCSAELTHDSAMKTGIVRLLEGAANSGKNGLTIEGIDYGYRDPEHLGPDDLILALASRVRREFQMRRPEEAGRTTRKTRQGLPTNITFPYSRHSSYGELCLLISAFRPRNIFPCTVDEHGWSEARSMSALFGHLYEKPLICTHDQVMLQKLNAIRTMTACKSAHQDEKSAGSLARHEIDMVPTAELPIGDKKLDCARAIRSRDSKRLRYSDLRSESTVDIHPLHSGVSDAASSIVGPKVKSGQKIPVEGDRTAIRSSIEQERDMAVSSADKHDCSSNHLDTGEDVEVQPSDPSRFELDFRQELYHKLAENASSWSNVDLISLTNHDDSQQEL